MKAYVLHGINDIRFEETSKPIPASGELLVKVSAAGICGSDIPRIYTSGAHRHPLILGHEFAGTVESVGLSADESFLGKRVGVFPLIPCGKCLQCRQKKYEMCSDYNYLGSRTNGAFSEYVVVPQRNAIVLPSSVSNENAAMLEPFAVAAHAIRQYITQSTSRDSRILVWGLGTIGIMITMLLKTEGFSNIYCVCKRDTQKNTLVNFLGFDDDRVFVINSMATQEKDVFDRFGKNFEISFECVGHPDSINAVVSLAGCGGRVILVGNPYSDINLDKKIYWQILRNQIEIRGTWNSSFTGDDDDDWHYVLRLMSEGDINPEFLITHRFNLLELINGFEIMRNKKEPYIKVMLKND